MESLETKRRVSHGFKSNGITKPLKFNLFLITSFYFLLLLEADYDDNDGEWGDDEEEGKSHNIFQVNPRIFPMEVSFSLFFSSPKRINTMISKIFL